NVTITVTPNAQVDLGGGAGVGIPLTFTPVNWQTPQQVNVLAVNDAIAEGAHAAPVAFAVASADTAYNGLAVPDVSVQITDNDTVGVLITESGGSTLVVEGGITDGFTVR